MNNETKVLDIFVDDIIPNRFQPRLSFDDSKIVELSNSIKIHGIIQPLVLRQVADKYEIIAGERRYKAAIMAGLQKVPAIINNLDDNQSAEVALVENIQRRDLSAIEEAKSFKKLLDRGYLTQDQLAQKMGISQPAMSNKLRLLNLDEAIQKALLEEKISERHARSLLSVTDFEKQKELLQKILTERLTVKQLDGEIKKMNSGTPQGEEFSIEKFDASNETNLLELSETNSTENQPTNNTGMIMEPPIVDNKEIKSDEGQKESSFVDLTQIAQGPINTFFEPINSASNNGPIEAISVPSFDDLPITNGDNTKIVITPTSESIVSPESIIPIQTAEKHSEGFSKITDIMEFANKDKESINSSEEPKEISIRIEKSNFRTVENAFETLKKEIVAAGLKIDMDTYSFDEYYQLIIKVYK